MSETSGLLLLNKICQPPPSVLINKTILQRRRFDVTFETAAFYSHLHPEICTTVYTEELIASPEILSESPQTQDDNNYYCDFLQL